MNQTNEVLDIGKLLGRREAFGLVAGRCSAAEVSCLREIREEKKFLALTATWDDFCTAHLHMHRTTVDKNIRLLEQFGPGYFEVAQLVRISPETFRAIAPVVKDNTITIHGEAVALIPENAGKVAAAIAELRNAAQQAPPPSLPRPISERLPNATRRCYEALEEVAGMYRSAPAEFDRKLLDTAVEELEAAVARLKLGIAA